MFFFHFVKVLLVNKLVLLQQIPFFYDLKKNVKIKLMPKMVNTLSFAQLKSCGLSKMKVKGIQSLSKANSKQIF